MSNNRFPLRMLVLCVFATGALSHCAWAQSLGDLARDAREARKSHAAQPVKVYTNEDIPQWPNEVVWKSAATIAPQAAPMVQAGSELPTVSPIKMRSEDVECSFSFRAQSMLPRGKAEPAGVTPLPASEVAKLEGTASIWGDTLDVSIHNDTGWALREVTVRLLPGIRAGDSQLAHSHAAEHGNAADPGAGDAGRLLDLRLSAEPHTATVSSEPLAQSLSGQEWSWEIVQAKGIPPK